MDYDDAVCSSQSIDTIEALVEREDAKLVKANSNLQKIQTTIPLTEEEQAFLERLWEWFANTPPLQARRTSAA
ncbi:hypothetical protein [Nocardiopsis synnemataformans]|uniref:hypothetical protein n=1 Tax=Nocardiopsis synnemataformans TaxID=61305 RepID=UPI003EB7F033